MRLSAHTQARAHRQADLRASPRGRVEPRPKHLPGLPSQRRAPAFSTSSISPQPLRSGRAPARGKRPPRQYSGFLSAGGGGSPSSDERAGQVRELLGRLRLQLLDSPPRFIEVLAGLELGDQAFEIRNRLRFLLAAGE